MPQGLTHEEERAALTLLNSAGDVSRDAIDFLVRWMDGRGAARHVHTRRHRIKTIDGIAEKVVRKRLENRLIDGRRYVWTDITDIVGLRFVTNYRADILVVAECIFSALLSSGRPFSRDGLREIKYFFSNSLPDADRLGSELRTLIEQERLPTDTWSYSAEQKEFYSSIHFVTRARSTNGAWVPVEIQVRSMFEDAWGEVDHRLVFEHRRSQSKGQIPYHLRDYTKAFKKMMDAAADFADVMRELSRPAKLPAMMLDIRLTDLERARDICGATKTPVQIRERVLDLFERLQALEHSIRTGDQSASHYDYFRFATEFAEVREIAADMMTRQDCGIEAIEAVDCMLGVEEAVCRLLSRLDTQIDTAAESLRVLSEKYQKSPLVFLRLGQAQAALLDTLTASPAASRAATLGLGAYDALPSLIKKLPKNADKRRLLISEMQEAYIRDNLARLHSFLAWRTAQKRRGNGPATRTTLIAARVAAGIAYRALDQVKDAVAHKRLLNSFCYYAAEVLELSRLWPPKSDSSGLPCSTAELEERILKLEAAQRSSNDGPDGQVKVWDSISYAWLALENQPRAKDAAAVVLRAYNEYLAQRPADAPPVYVTDYQAKAYERALKILDLLGTEQ